MRVFIAHAHSDKDVARRVAVKLRTRNVGVFLDEDTLPKGDEFDERIRSEIHDSDVFVFLVSAASLQPGTYAQTELRIAKKRWPNPRNRVLPVLLEPLKLSQIDPYLSSTVTALIPDGDVATEAVEETTRMLDIHRWRRIAWASGATLATLATGGAVYAFAGQPWTERSVASARLAFSDQTATATATATESNMPPPPPSSTYRGRLLAMALPARSVRLAIGSHCSTTSDTAGQFALECIGGPEEDASVTKQNAYAPCGTVRLSAAAASATDYPLPAPCLRASVSAPVSSSAAPACAFGPPQATGKNSYQAVCACNGKAVDTVRFSTAGDPLTKLESFPCP